MEIKVQLCVLLSIIAVFAFSNAQDCGKVQANIDDVNSNLPWMVQFRERSTNEVFCMGTLVSNKHVLVAAHCLWPKPYFKALKEINNVYVTINNVNVDLMGVIINSDWNFNKNVFDGDVALVTLFNPVTISSEIQPICLPPFSGPLVQPGGVVAGINGASQSNVRQRVNVEKNEDCFRNLPTSVKNASERTFCAKYPGEDLAVSNEFSGGYFYEADSRWYIQGVESKSFVQKNQCEILKHSVFSNIGWYAEWIQKIIKRDTEKIWKDIELKCTFVKNYEGLYGCEVENLVINSPNIRIASVSGQHTERNSNQEVEYVWIKNSRVVHMPRFDAPIFFPKLVKYLVTGSGVKFVERDDFSALPKLETLDLSNNEIEELPEDTLFDLNELVDFFIDNNKIRALSGKMLSFAPNFQRFKASNNSIEILESEFFTGNPSLKIVSLDNNKLHKIRVDFRPFRNLKKLDFKNNPCVDTNFNDWRKYKTIVIVQKEIETTCR